MIKLHSNDDSPILQQSTTPVIRVEDASINTGGSEQLRIELSSLPNGLSGFEFRIVVGSVGVGKITRVGYPSSFKLTRPPDIHNRGASASVKAADISNAVTEGMERFPLSFVEVQGKAEGTTSVTVDQVRIDDDSGQPISTIVDGGTIHVESSPAVTNPYDLRAGTTKTVDLGYGQFYVIQNIPNTSGFRRAVTKPDYSLVDLSTTRDALWTATYIDKHDFRENIREELQQAKRQQRDLMIREMLLRLAGPLGMNILELYTVYRANILTGDPVGLVTDTIPVIVDMVTDVAAAFQDAREDPYQSAIVKLASSSRSLQWTEQQLANTRSTSGFTPEIEELIDSSSELGTHVRSASDLLDAWQTFGRGLANLNKPASGLFFKGSAIQAVDGAVGILIDQTIDRTFNTTEEWMVRNAKIVHIFHTLNTLRIPIFQVLLHLEEKALNGELTPPEIVRYHTYKFTAHQLASLSFDFSSYHYEQMAGVDDLALNEAFEVIQNVSRRADRHAAIKEDEAKSAVAALTGLSAFHSQAVSKFETSINKALLGDTGADDG